MFTIFAAKYEQNSHFNTILLLKIYVVYNLRNPSSSQHHESLGWVVTVICSVTFMKILPHFICKERFDWSGMGKVFISTNVWKLMCALLFFLLMIIGHNNYSHKRYTALNYKIKYQNTPKIGILYLHT